MEVGPGPLSGQSILVLEDEPVLALELNFTLRDAGATVYVARDSETAIRALEMLGTSAAVLDINLGRKDCSAVCERLSDSGILQMIKRSETDSILIEEMGRRKDIPRHLFQQLIAKAADNTRKRLGGERPGAATQIGALVADVTGSLHSKFGPASRSYFDAKRGVSAQHYHGNLNERAISDYAQARKFEEAIIALSLLCSLPVHVVELALVGANKEMVLILTKALGFSWETTMSLLFLGAPDHRIHAQHLDTMKREFDELNQETSRSVLETYKSRKHASIETDQGRLPQLHGQ